MNEEDYKHFMFLLYACNTTKSIELRKLGEKFDREETIVEIGAFCLMPNHFHILIREKENGGISKYMLKLMTSYSMYFNKKYERTGKLYEGVFKSTHLNNDKYLKYMYSYIHLNPCKLLDKNWRENKKRNTSKLLDYAFSYKYSSLQEYTNKKYIITHNSEFPTYFDHLIEHRQELFEWLSIDTN